MKTQEVKDIIACLPHGKTELVYQRDHYALFLLKELIKHETKISVRQLKTSKLKSLLARPIVANILRQTGNGLLTADQLSFALANQSPDETQKFLLTVDEWDDWQTSARDHNLVLQLNLDEDRYLQVKEAIKSEEDPFSFGGHPIARTGYFTFAWARLDVDLASGEAIVEEIQSDWQNEIKYILELIRDYRDDNENLMREAKESWGIICDVSFFRKLFLQGLRPLMKLWQEAMLYATIWFLTNELGIRRIFYHTYDSGIAVKNINGGTPPRSVYESLPRKFCFKPTDKHPLRVLRSKKNHVRWLLKNKKLKWQLLDLHNKN